jgi:DNA-binding transcriptional ArsR family regulator
MAAPLALLEQPDHVRLALSPMRRRLLERLRTPRSATQLASELALGRQRINYHLRALERAGLIELVENRQRRGCVERILVARARAFIVDPAVMAGPSPVATASATSPAAAQDRFAAEHLIGTAADIVRDVGRMQARAHQQRTRLLTCTIDTEITFATPADLEHFASELAEFVARQAARLGSPDGRRYRVVVGAHPAPRDGRHPAPRQQPFTSATNPSSAQTAGDSHGRTRSRSRRNPRRRTH